MKYTSNYKMKKPESTDSYNVDDFNENTEIIDAELKNHTDRLYGNCNKNLVPNILPLSADMNTKVSANPITLAKVSMLHFGDIKWVLKMSGTQKDWSVYVGDIGDGTDDANFGGACKRYVGYEKPSGSGHQCYGLFCRISACGKTVFKAGNYTVSFWACVEGTSANLCPHITTAEPSQALGDNIGDKIGGIAIGKWQKIAKTVSITKDTDTLYVILDSFAPSQSTQRKLRCADIKLEYGSVATRFDPDYSKESMLQKLAEI